MIDESETRYRILKSKVERTIKDIKRRKAIVKYIPMDLLKKVGRKS